MTTMKQEINWCKEEVWFFSTEEELTKEGRIPVKVVPKNTPKARVVRCCLQETKKPHKHYCWSVLATCGGTEFDLPNWTSFENIAKENFPMEEIE